MTKVDTTKYSNLTKAISNGKPIDFRKLDGRKAVLVDGEGGVVYYVYLERYSEGRLPYRSEAWRMLDEHFARGIFVEDSESYRYWYGRSGESIWVYGDIPLIPEKTPRLIDFRDTINGEPTDEDLKRLDGKTAYLNHPEHGNLKVKLVYKNQTSGITVDTEVGRYPLHILLTYAYTNDKGWKLLVEENND